MNRDIGRRGRNITVFEGSKASPIHNRRNTAAPNFSPQRYTSNVIIPQEPSESNETWNDDNADQALSAENFQWYDSNYQGYEYENEWPQYETQQGQYEVENVPGEEGQDAQIDYYPQNTEYSGYDYSTIQQGGDQSNDLVEEVDNSDAPYEIAVAGGPIVGSGPSSPIPSKSSESKSPTVEELSLKLRGQQILLQQSLHQIKALEDEKKNMEQKYTSDISELSHMNEKLRENIQEFETRNRHCEEKLKNCMMTIDQLETETKRIENENKTNLNLLTSMELEKLTLKRNIDDLQNEINNLQKEYQEYEQELRQQFVKETTSISTQTDDNTCSISIQTDEDLSSLTSTSIPIQQHEDRLHELQSHHQHELQQIQQQNEQLIQQIENIEMKLSSSNHEILKLNSTITHQVNELKLLEIKLKAANYEIENINKLLQIAEEKVINYDLESYNQLIIKEENYQKEIQRKDEVIHDLEEKKNEIEKQLASNNEKIVLLKNKVNAYKEINCLTCGENFYQSILKLRNKFQSKEDGQQQQHQHHQQQQQHQDSKKKLLTSHTAIITTTNHKKNNNHNDHHYEEIPRVGIHGIRRLRVQSAHERRRRRTKSPSKRYIE